MNIPVSRSPPSRPVVLVTQCDFRYGFHVARSLTAAGYPVVAMAQAFPSMSDGLPGVVGRMAYPNPFDDPDGYVSAVAAAAARWNATLLIPVHEDVFVASRLRSRMPHTLHVAAPDFQTLMALHDKYTLARISHPHGLGCPDTVVVTQLPDVERHLPGLGGLAVLKPRHGEGGIGRKIVSRACLDQPRERARIASLLQQQDYVLQRHVRGEGVCVGMLADDGVLQAISGHRRVREFPRNGGTSTARRVFSDEALFFRIEPFVRSLRYTGVLMLEFRHDTAAGTFHLIDANPRYWGGLSLHMAAGIDYPALHVARVLGQSGTAPALPIAVDTPVESRWLLGEAVRAMSSALALDFTQAMAPFRPTPGVRVVYEDSGVVGLRGIAAQLYAYARTGRRKSGPAMLQRRQAFFHGE